MMDRGATVLAAADTAAAAAADAVYKVIVPGYCSSVTDWAVSYCCRFHTSNGHALWLHDWLLYHSETQRSCSEVPLALRIINNTPFYELLHQVNKMTLKAVYHC